VENYRRMQLAFRRLQEERQPFVLANTAANRARLRKLLT